MAVLTFDPWQCAGGATPYEQWLNRPNDQLAKEEAAQLKAAKEAKEEAAQLEAARLSEEKVCAKGICRVTRGVQGLCGGFCRAYYTLKEP